jgi:hypothetical protein
MQYQKSATNKNIPKDTQLKCYKTLAYQSHWLQEISRQSNWEACCRNSFISSSLILVSQILRRLRRNVMCAPHFVWIQWYHRNNLLNYLHIYVRFFFSPTKKPQIGIWLFYINAVIIWIRFRVTWIVYEYI